MIITRQKYLDMLVAGQGNLQSGLSPYIRKQTQVAALAIASTCEEQ